MISVLTLMNITNFLFMITQLKTSLANFYFRSVCIKLEALRLNWHQEVAFSVKKVGDPSCTSIINYTLSVSEYVATNVTAKPVTFRPGTNHGCTVVSHMCSCDTLTVTRK